MESTGKPRTEASSPRPTGARATLAAALLFTVAIFGGSSPASAGEWDDAAYAVALTNDVRAWSGAAPLQTDWSLSSVAADWAAQLAWNGYLAHNPNVASQVGGWWALGENVGYGGSVDAVHEAWVNSWHHYGNIVDPGYTHIGVGVAYDGYGGVYIVQVFAAF